MEFLEISIGFLKFSQNFFRSYFMKIDSILDEIQIYNWDKSIEMLGNMIKSLLLSDI